MSSDSYESYKEKMAVHAPAARPMTREDREELKKKRAKQVGEARARVVEKKERKTRAVADLFDETSVRLGLTSPARGVERVHIFLVDNSGSNRVIAEHLRSSSGYLIATLESIDPAAQFAFVYFSDHCDGHLYMQEVDFVSPNKEGDRVLFSSTSRVKNAGGGDAPEAIECALWDMCELDFNEARERHLYLVTDVVGHGMGMSGDGGCEFQRDWQASVARVRETFTSFSVIGCGDDAGTGELQKQFLAPERVPYDLMDLSSIKNQKHRMGITGNALLFLVARHRGMQSVEMFLGFLYDKWLDDPVFGANTDLKAQEAIRRFGKYLEARPEEVDALMDKILDV